MVTDEVMVGECSVYCIPSENLHTIVMWSSIPFSEEAVLKWEKWSNGQIRSVGSPSCCLPPGSVTAMHATQAFEAGETIKPGFTYAWLVTYQIVPLS
jgi:hypothetical protein